MSLYKGIRIDSGIIINEKGTHAHEPFINLHSLSNYTIVIKQFPQLPQISIKISDNIDKTLRRS